MIAVGILNLNLNLLPTLPPPNSPLGLTGVGGLQVVLYREAGVVAKMEKNNSQA